MKYTKQEKKKLGQISSALAKTREQMRVLAERQKKVEGAARDKLLACVKRHRASLLEMDKEERKFQRAVDNARRTPEQRAASRVESRLCNQRYDIECVVRHREAKAAVAKREAAQQAPLTPAELKTVEQRLTANNRPIKDGKTIVFKRVSKDFKTRIGYSDETKYPIGKMVNVSNWNPRGGECGSGKLHACYRPGDCDQYTYNERTDRYIAIEVALADMYAWPNPTHPVKIAFRKGKVLYEVTRLGNKKQQRKEKAVY